MWRRSRRFVISRAGRLTPVIPDNPSTEVKCSLPLPLQDLSLLVLISDLDSYPVELLASLPRWIRYLLLDNLPAIDLCRLDNTPIARDIDVDELWDLRWRALNSEDKIEDDLARRTQPETFQSLFQLSVQVGPQSRSRGSSPGPASHLHELLPLAGPPFKELELAFEYLRQEPGSELPASRENYLLKIASDIVSQSSNFQSDIKTGACKLISIHGDNLLPGLKGHRTTFLDYNHSVWKTQATALKVQVVHVSIPISICAGGRLMQASASDNQEILTAHRLTSICEKSDTLELLSILTNECRLQPLSINLHVDKISEPILHNLYTGKLSQDNRLSLPSHSMTCISVMNHFLRRGVILRLQCDKYANIGVMISIVEAATTEGNDCKLKHLFCTIPDLYNDVVQPFSDLFLLPNFHQLNLDLDDIYLLTLSKLIQGFMTAPCSHTQHLTIHIKKNLPLLTNFETRQLAALDMGGATIPQCAAQHKMLRLSSIQFTRALHLLLQFPTIRLNEIILVCHSDYYPYLHLCALHPDLQVVKLVMYVSRITNQSSLATAQEDLVSLLKMHTLQTIFISGNWGHHKEVKLGLMQGLNQRSHLYPLRKIYLNVSSGYCREDFQGLWNTIFSLPQLNKLKVILGKDFMTMARQLRFTNVIYESWVEKSSKKLLKSMTVPKTFETEFKHLTHVAQTISFTSKNAFTMV